MADRAVRVDNLAQVRKALRGVDKDALKAVQAVTRQAAEIVAVKARVNAPRRSGRLAGSIRATTSGAKGIVRSPLPYAAVQEYGGTISPRGTPLKIKRHEFVGRALESERDRVVNELAKGFDDLARRNGWT